MPDIEIIKSEQQAAPYFTIQEQNTNPANFLGRIQEQVLDTYVRTALTEVLDEASKATGGYVMLRPNEYYVPVLIGSNNKPVPLYELVELLDEFVDFDGLKTELPTLSYSQIYGAFSFLRKVAQHNLLGIDLDEAQERADMADADLISELRRALTDRDYHVFNIEQ